MTLLRLRSRVAEALGWTGAGILVGGFAFLSGMAAGAAVWLASLAIADVVFDVTPDTKVGDALGSAHVWIGGAVGAVVALVHLWRHRGGGRE